jgi:hypothetical protein
LIQVRKVEEEFEDTKGVIKTRKSKKDRQQNGRKTCILNDLILI